MLTFLFGLQVESSQTTEILLAHSFVHGGATTNTFAVVMSGVRPPVGLHFDVPQDHVLDGDRQSGNLNAERRLIISEYLYCTRRAFDKRLQDSV